MYCNTSNFSFCHLCRTSFSRSATLYRSPYPEFSNSPRLSFSRGDSVGEKSMEEVLGFDKGEECATRVYLSATGIRR